MNGVIFREATENDAERLAELALQLNLFHDDKTVTHTKDYINQWEFLDAFVIVQSDVIIGYAAGYPTFHFDCALRGYDIQSVCIDEKYRGAGHAKFLLQNLIKLKHAQGIKRFSLSYHEWNKGAQKCYASVGFKERASNQNSKAILMGDDLENMLSH